MLKRIAAASLKPGIDPDDFWEFHKKVHAVEAAAVGGDRLKRYVINRVTRVLSGEPVFFDLIESWWANEKEMRQAWDIDSWQAKSAVGKSIQDDFWSKTTAGFTAVAEEYIAKDSPRRHPVKRVSVCWLPEGTDTDQFWKYHTRVHTLDAMKVAGPRLKKYAISRVGRVIMGKPMFFDLTETWWDSEEDMHQGFDIGARTYKLTSGKTVAEDFWYRVAGGFTALVDEYVVK